jgi:hypothetical protein
MNDLTDILNVISEEFSKIKNKFVRKKVVEGMDCAEGYLDVDGDCMKEIKTVNIFLTIPIANTVILSVFALISAAFLYKFKSTPLAVNKTGTVCKEVDLSRIFKKNILEGVVWDDLYDGKTLKQRMDFEKYEKIVFPSLSKEWYPAGVKLEDVVVGEDATTIKMIPMKFILMLPLYISLKFATKLFYKTFATFKAALYKHKQWGGIQEIDKINKESWIKDLIMVFFIIPFFLTFIIPLIFMVQVIWSFLVAPGWTFLQIFKNSDMKMRVSDPDNNPVIEGLKTFGKLFGYFIGLMFGGVAFSLIIFLLMIGWFFSTITGFSAQKAGGPRIIWKTFGNLIWDYKYIWALLAIGIWLLNLEVYLKGPHNILSFINSKNREMVVGIIGGICAVMLLGKQAKFFKYLPKMPKSRTDCYPNCNPPVDINSDSVKKANCPKKDLEV